MILTTESEDNLFKNILVTTMLHLVTHNLMSTNEKKISVTTKVILATEEVETTKNILATNKLMSKLINKNMFSKEIKVKHK